MSKKSISSVETHPEKCVGCRICQLYCSFLFTRKYNPSEARLSINRDDNQNIFEISFTDECNDCGLCAEYCMYGALEFKEKE